MITDQSDCRGKQGLGKQEGKQKKTHLILVLHSPNHLDLQSVAPPIPRILEQMNHWFEFLDQGFELLYHRWSQLMNRSKRGIQTRLMISTRLLLNR